MVVGPHLIPPPAGADLTTPEGLAQAMPVLGPKHFVFPSLARALRTFFGAMTAHLVAANRRNEAQTQKTPGQPAGRIISR